MGIVNKLVIKCGSQETEFTIGLQDTNDSGINAILGAINPIYGVYSYSHSVEANAVQSIFSIDEASGCESIFYKDGQAVSSGGQCCLEIDPALLISSDTDNSLILGTDGKFYVEPSTNEIYVDGGSLNATTNTLILTDNDAGTPDVTIELDALRQTKIPLVINGSGYAVGTDYDTILNALRSISHIPAVLRNNVAPFSWSTANQLGNIPTPTIGNLVDGSYVLDLGDGTTPITISDDKIDADIIIDGVTYTTGTDFETILNALNALAHKPMAVTNNAAPYSFDATTQSLNIPQVPSIVNGQLVQGDGTPAEQIPDFWRVNRTATGALPDGTTDVTEKIGHKSDIYVGADALVTVGHGGGDITSNTALGNYALENNTTGQSNVSVGQNSMFSNNSGSFNVASGIDSLYSNKSGNSNIGIGFYSIYSNTTGSNNIGIGSSSLFSNISGTSNVGNGSNSLRSNTTGIQNVAIGANSLFSNTIGLNNVATGVNSLYNNTTGTDNVANGASSLRNNTIGISNVASGSNSLYNNRSGSFNVAKGVSALYSNTTGSNNVSIGRDSLYSNTIGNENVGSGQSSLYSNTEAIQNVAIGVSSLYYNQENNNTAIGAKSFNSYNLLLNGATITASSATQVTLSAPMTPAPAVGSFITISIAGGYTNTISGFLLKSYRVVNDTTLEVADPSQVLGLTGTVTNFEIRQSKGYTNSSALGFDSEPYASNQVVLGNNLVTTTVLGDKIAFDLVSIQAAAIGTTLKVVGTTTGAFGGTVKIIGV